MMYFGESYNEVEELERDYYDYMEQQHQEYLEKEAEDWAYDNVILPEYFESLELATLFLTGRLVSDVTNGEDKNIQIPH